MEKCEMKGYLSFLILWILRKKGMKGVEIAHELEKRKGKRPSPGTIYPTLKDLKNKGLIEVDENKTCFLTEMGKENLSSYCKSFCRTFYDVDEMFDFE